ncbi:MAG: ABC transporter substrate-binding protein [Hyphomicrobiales bacterium]
MTTIDEMMPIPAALDAERPFGLSAGLACLAAASLSALLLAAPAKAADPIEIGMSVALTGYLASFDGQVVDGAKLAVKRVNDAGGADGHELRLHILDNASNATTGVTVTNQLLNQFNVAVMINGASSAQSVAILPIAARNKVPFITTSQLPPQPVWAFLAGPAYEEVLERQLQFAKQRLKAKKIAFLYSQTPYGQNGAKLLAKRAPELGLEIVFLEGAEGSVTDLTPQVSKAKDAQPDALLDFFTGPIHIVEAKAAATVGLTVPIIMAHDDSAVASQAAANFANSYNVVLAVQAFPNIQDAQLKKANGDFLKIYEAAKLDPAGVGGASWGWDAVYTLVTAVTETHGVSGEPLRAALEKVDFFGTTAHYKFTPSDHTGQVETGKGLQIGQFKSGKVEIVDSGS